LRAECPTGRCARSIQDLLSALAELLDDVVHDHLVRGDFRRRVEDVFGDHELGGAIGCLEQGHVLHVRDALRRVIGDRYGEVPV